MPALFDFGIQPLELVARTAIVYVVFILVLRVFGKRELGQFTIFDLALLLLAANALQPAMTGPDTSVAGGLVILATVFALNWLTARAREHVPWLRRLLEPEPTVLARDGAWLDTAVRAEDLDEDDLAAALRQHGLERVEDARLVVLEQDGSVSVVPKETDGDALRRRRRPALRL
jgi:uncharacterized membrane protein YcaP (DUF421 family)